MRREVGARTVSHYCLSNAPEDTLLEELARLQAQRYFIEHSFREAKSECGLADYQVRRWDAWRHHMALVMLGTLFLVKQKLAARQHWPMMSLNDLVTVMAHLLPRRQQCQPRISPQPSLHVTVCGCRRRNPTPKGHPWRWGECDKVELVGGRMSFSSMSLEGSRVDRPCPTA
ncbi:MAG: hypothetical protein M3A44_00380 [Gammaproteobacteria bacterium]